MNLLPRSTRTCPTSQAPPWAPTTQNREGLRGPRGTSPASQARRGAGEPEGQPKAANIIIKQVSGATADPVSSCSLNYRAFLTVLAVGTPRPRTGTSQAGTGVSECPQEAQDPIITPQTLLYVSLWWWGFCQTHGRRPSALLLQPWPDCSFLPGAPASFSTWIILISPVSL